MQPLHPKVQIAATVAGLLFALDTVIVALNGAVPSAPVVTALAIAHVVLPIVAAYLKSGPVVKA